MTGGTSLKYFSRDVWGTLGNLRRILFLKDLLRDVRGTLAGGTSLKDFLRDVGGTLWGTGSCAAVAGTGGTFSYLATWLLSYLAT